jgi:hypothetical protein
MPTSLAMRRDEHDKHNRKVVSIQYARGPLALVQQSSGEVVEGALAALAPVAFTARSIVVRAPWIDVLALAPRTLEWSIFPPQYMDVGLILVYMEELVDVCAYRHGMSISWERMIETETEQRFSPIVHVLHCYKRREIERTK